MISVANLSIPKRIVKSISGTVRDLSLHCHCEWDKSPVPSQSAFRSAPSSSHGTRVVKSCLTTKGTADLGRFQRMVADFLPARSNG
jgi:hypothetical protein